MPKKIDEELQTHAVRLVDDHQGNYSSLTAAAGVVANQLGVGKECVRRRVIQSQVDGGRRASVTSEELVEIKTLKAKVRGLEEDDAILKSATFSSPGTRPPQPLIRGVHRHHEKSGPRGRVGLSGPV